MKYFTTQKISDNIHETPEGFLLCLGVPITRVGDFVYGDGETPLETNDDGEIIISRDPEDVFEPETLASFEGKPITINHPQGFVNPDNWNVLAVGTMQNIRQGKKPDNDKILADLLITDKRAIVLVKNGLREVSCGYEAEYTQTGDGTGKQTEIRGNHLALVTKGRAGSTCAIFDNHKGDFMKLSKLKEMIGATIDGIMDDEARKAVAAAKDAKKSKDDDDETDDAAFAAKKIADKKAKDKKAKDAKEAADKKAADAKKAKDKKAKDDEDETEDSDDDDDVGTSAAQEGRLSAMEARLNALESAADEDDDDEDTDDEDTMDDDEVSEVKDLLSKLMDAIGGKSKDKSKDKKAKDKKKDDDDDDADEDDDDGDTDDSKGCVTGDTAARAEILAPGISKKGTADQVMKAALKTCYATKDGKKVIETLTGGKTFDAAQTSETMFIAAAEMLKSKRKSEMAGTKSYDFDSSDEPAQKTAEDINAINEKHFGLNK